MPIDFAGFWHSVQIQGIISEEKATACNARESSQPVAEKAEQKETGKRASRSAID